MKIDLGGIAKGYTSQRIAKVYKEDGVKSGVISLGEMFRQLVKKQMEVTGK